MIRKTFLYRLYKTSRPWFFAICIFIAVTALNHKTSVEITPFFIWGMYSQINNEKPLYHLYEVTVNDSTKIQFDNTFLEPRRTMILLSLDKYEHFIKNGGRDPLENFAFGMPGAIHKIQHHLASTVANTPLQIAAYSAWLKRYISHSWHMKVDILKVDILTFYYNAEGNPIIIDTANLIDQ